MRDGPRIGALAGLSVLGLTLTVVRADAPQKAAQKAAPTQAATSTEAATRRSRGERVLNALTGGNGRPPHFQELERDFPELADLTLQYALGDIWGRDVLPPRPVNWFRWRDSPRRERCRSSKRTRNTR